MPVAGSLFSGEGALDFGLTLAGWEHAFFCEVKPERREILSLRWPGVPVYGDVRDVDGSAPRVDLLAFGFPCKGGSTAGKRTGLDHPETALWREAARVVRELRPRLLLVENVANLLAVRGGDAWAEVLGDLATLGYVCAWDCLPAAGFGAPHLRDRVFCVAAYAGGQAHAGNGASRDPAWARDHASAGRRSAASNAERDGVRLEPVTQLGSSGTSLAPGVGRAAAHPAERAEGASVAAWRECAGRTEPDGSGHAAADTDTAKLAPEDGAEPTIATADARRLGVRVEWDRFGGAIERWESIHGPAPEPLCFFRGVDARAAARVERSRLSALGDGVQMQAGVYLGEQLMELVS